MLVERMGNKELWGQVWLHEIEQCEESTENYNETGMLIDVFTSADYGKIAFMYVIPKDLNIKPECINALLGNIKKANANNTPYIIYEDNKYKDECKSWNSHNNIVYSKKEFESMISKEFQDDDKM
jgi:adenine C2-methylase RlmN of 23S rRNA A2503 and tRNA A37